MYILAFLWPFHFVSSMMVLTINLLLDFCVNQGQVTLVVIHPQHGHTSFPMDRALMVVESHN
jgi:hypothetical protein